MKKGLVEKLEEISKVVNSFKSEAVQLKVVDILLKDALLKDEESDKKEPRESKILEKPIRKVPIKEKVAKEKPTKEVIKIAEPVIAKKGRKPKVKTESKQETVATVIVKKEGKKPSLKKTKLKESEIKKDVGASKTIQNLIADGYFKEKRSVNDVMQYCSKKLKKSIKATDAFTILSRMVKTGTLKREKNKETSKFEYFTA